MSMYCKDDHELCFTDLPLYSVLTEWLIQNMYVPSDFASVVSNIVLFLLTWYMLKLIFRLVLSILWPLIIFCCGLIIFRILQHAELLHTVKYLLENLGDIFQLIVNSCAKLPYTLNKIFGPDTSAQYTW